MRKNRITLEYLKKKVWWWRPGAENHPAPNPAPFESENALAFNYELTCRADRLRCLAPFPVLQSTHHAIIRQWLGKPYALEIPSRYAGNESQENEKGWTHVRPKLQWNLNLSERVLVKAFLVFIRQDRNTQAISAPAKPDKRKRPIPWTWLELMDTHDFKIRALGNNERSSLSMARKVAKRQLELFDEALDSYWQQQGEEDEEPEPDMAAFGGFSPLPVSGVPLWRDIWPQVLPKR